MTDDSTADTSAPHSEETVSTSTNREQTPADAGSDDTSDEHESKGAFEGVHAVDQNLPGGTEDVDSPTQPKADVEEGLRSEPTDGPSPASDEAQPGDDDSDAFTDAHVGTLEPPQRSDTTEKGSLSIPNYAQDLLDFEFVLEAHDEFLPNSVNGAGMVVTGEDEFVGIAEISPRSWSIHTAEKKTEIIQTYKSAFLATLDFPIQIVSYPTTFDISDHVERLKDVTAAGRTHSTDSQLVTLGRQVYPDWLDRFIKRNDMKQRQFYVVVPISETQINQFRNEDSGLLQAAADAFSPLEPVAEFFHDGTESSVSTQQCLRELDSRLDRVASSLHRLDIRTTRLSDRDAVMSVLYHYYNNEQPVNGSFPTGPYSAESTDAPDTTPQNSR
ncbi:hypothetical protein C440_06587 [Haloferax mucosum ATCC BAA-1512]|uniref:TraC-like domain-containing protein n=1 Tax=Haloferax mucosum ATCC BAA-1512 TaxID=662479 RepID=M0IGP4_9EURY|nr:hypothetical protein [Haloferax mucosum]ELZ95936.1 hypothetical protein C440_06587 [Haloferax mucosum ATCC BAA-1512]